MLHSDIQLLIITPKDPTTPIGGVSTIFDRNLNSNTALGFDLTAPSQYVDKAGPPQLLSLTFPLTPILAVARTWRPTRREP